MAHQPKSKELTFNHASVQAQNTKNKKPHQMCTYKKLVKQENNVLKSQITKRGLRSHKKGLHPKCEKIETYSHWS
jgi:hypothetical protein